MSGGVQYALVMTLVPLTYIIVFCALLAKGWVLRAGIATLVIALLPVWWLMSLPSEEVEAPGTGMLLMVGMLPLSISALTIGAGVVMLIVKRFCRQKAS